MCALAPHVPVTIEKLHKPDYITYFGWEINGTDALYFRY